MRVDLVLAIIETTDQFQPVAVIGQAQVLVETLARAVVADRADIVRRAVAIKRSEAIAADIIAGDRGQGEVVPEFGLDIERQPFRPGKIFAAGIRLDLVSLQQPTPEFGPGIEARIAPGVGAALKIADTIGQILPRVIFGIIGLEVDIDRIDRLEAKRDAARDRIGGAEVQVLRRIERIAIALASREGGANARLVLSEGQLDRALGLDRVIIAVAERQITVVAREIGLAGDEVDRAARRIAAVKRALRPAQDFDALEIIKLLAVARAEALIDFVDIDPDRRCRRSRKLVGDRDAAEREIGLRIRIGRGHLDIGQAAHEVTRLADPARREIFGREGRDGGGNILKILRPLLGGHDDVAEPARARRFVGRSGILRRRCVLRPRRDGRERNHAPGDEKGGFSGIIISHFRSP